MRKVNNHPTEDTEGHEGSTRVRALTSPANICPSLPSKGQGQVVARL